MAVLRCWPLSLREVGQQHPPRIVEIAGIPLRLGEREGGADDSHAVAAGTHDIQRLAAEFDGTWQVARMGQHGAAADVYTGEIELVAGQFGEIVGFLAGEDAQEHGAHEIRHRLVFQGERGEGMVVCQARQARGKSAIGEQRRLESIDVVVARAAWFRAGFTPAEGGEHVGNHQAARLGERGAVALIGEPGEFPRAVRRTEVGLVFCSLAVLGIEGRGRSGQRRNRRVVPRSSDGVPARRTGALRFSQRVNPP